MYCAKYKKYKIKNQQIGGTFDKNFILVDGTSSAGKTTICKYFNDNGYACLVGDDFGKKLGSEFKEFYKTIKNDYFSQREFRENLFAKIIVDDAIDKKKAMIDWIKQKNIIQEFERRRLGDQLYVIVVYTSLENLARNLESRRKEGDLRGVFAFGQFSKRYIKTENADTDTIDTVNRAKFKQILLDNFKYEFENETELNDFCNNIFAEMGIMDDKSHNIKLRDEFRKDYLLNTNNKSKDEIYSELKRIFE
jgi:broad-specificity NMP kinase